jgi:predicted nucleic acid-binding protein
MRVLIDTSIWVAIEKGEFSRSAVLDAIGNSDIYTNPNILGELKTGVELAPTSIVRRTRQQALDAVERFEMLTHDRSTAMQFGHLNAFVRQAGKTRNRMQDLWIAASALEHDLTLVTRNGRDFADIPNLKLAVV